jgi:hypothetical protein
VHNSFSSYAQSMALKTFDFGASDVSYSHSTTLSISAIKSFLCRSGVYPLLLSDLDYIDRVYEWVIGILHPSLSSTEVDHKSEDFSLIIPREYVPELLYCVSQYEEVGVRLNSVRDALSALPGWNKSTDNCRDNYLVMARLLLSEPPLLLTDTSLRDLLRPNPIPSLTQTSSPVKTRNTQSNTNTKPQVSLHPLRDVIFLLLHYPLVCHPDRTHNICSYDIIFKIFLVFESLLPGFVLSEPMGCGVHGIHPPYRESFPSPSPSPSRQHVSCEPPLPSAISRRRHPNVTAHGYAA